MTVYRSGSKQWPVGTTNGVPFSIDGDKGANLWVDLSIVNGGSLTVKLQQGSPGGNWVDVPGAVSTAIASISGSLIKIYPALTPVANQVVAGVLGGGAYRVVATVTGGAPTAQITLESIA